MSRSSLWVMDSKYIGTEVCEFNNSWFFSPIIWDVLLEKYLPDRRLRLFDGKVARYMSSLMSDKGLDVALNEAVNNCNCLPDRICWEMSNQQVFFTQDKVCISDAIKNFTKINKKYQERILEKEHILERFNEISDAIMQLDAKEDVHFIFKNTSCDDNVEYWFAQYDESQDEYEGTPLSKLDKHVTEFVVIKNGTINQFISNLDYFNNNVDSEIKI